MVCDSGDSKCISCEHSEEREPPSPPSRMY